jgi:uncharacterized protein YwqG
MFGSIQELRGSLEAAGLSPEACILLAELGRPGAWLETRRADSPVGATRIGGDPDLSRDMPWPKRVYANAADRAARYAKDAEAPDSNWSWATPEQCASFREDSRRMAEIVAKPFPLSFVAQIDLAQMWTAGALDPDIPRDGLISIFYDCVENPWGFDPHDHPGAAVLYHPAKVPSLQRRQQPSEFEGLERQTSFKPLACAAHGFLAPPAPWAPAVTALGLTTDDCDAFDSWWDDNLAGPSEDGSAFTCHRVGGWPTPVQGDMQTECALVSAGYYCGNGDAYRDPATEAIRATAAEWMLLAQIGSDSKADMMWGDVGQIYVWIRRADLRARRFTAARLIQQCH